LLAALLIPISVGAVPFTFTNGTVANANQVNANFAALQGMGPEFPSQLMDVQTSGVCVQREGAVALNGVLDGNATGSFLTIPNNFALVLTHINVAVGLGPAGAGHSISVQFARARGTVFAILDIVSLTLDSEGNGSVAIPLGVGSPFMSGAMPCVRSTDSSASGAVTSVFAQAHGFLTYSPP
jgi:hypothetical protein